MSKYEFVAWTDKDNQSCSKCDIHSTCVEEDAIAFKDTNKCCVEDAGYYVLTKKEYKFCTGTKVLHTNFGNGEVTRQNMSGPIVKFINYEDEMCCPEYSLEVIKLGGKLNEHEML